MYDSAGSHDSYHAYLTKRSRVSVFVRRLFIRDLARHFHGQVLDVGCGIGEFLNCYKAGFGVDANPLLVSECLQRGYKSCVAVAGSLPFASRSFDGVLISNVLEHLDDPKIALREAARVSRTEGILVITVPQEAGFRHDPTHVQMLRRSDIEELARGCGLTIRSIYHFPFFIKWLGHYLYFCELRAVMVRGVA
jgi:SAM-dependent methyltransferase